ncbi:RHS repeat-associated core domain-containing protein [Sulfurovum sp. TSL1]|uniref:RHS repeat-associated core domain-containing protein n=1 Tax=Sulfurovum sp. TSL1 TaxID=2826994 RepID=UPI001CC3EC2D|nr:RHS repeat-associated core domain-containing protein [Sulfurovum sp. TSL1]GIT97918.1 hypothetical protein TSL1_07390 [Sulfurovum sp. TSL1]
MACSFSFYGARYYDPRTSVWQSPDPILETYMNGGGNNGVYNPANINLYMYTYNNPVNLIDPTGMLTDNDGASISEHVYGDNPDALPRHLQQVSNQKELNSYGLSAQDLRDEASGFKAGVYRNTNTGEVTLAFAGTEDWRDGRTDVASALGQFPKQFVLALTAAKKFNNAMKGKDTALTGHSLGGGLAALSSTRTGIEAKTYNAMGINRSLIANLPTSQIDNYYVKGEILTSFQNATFAPTALGNQHEIPYGLEVGGTIFGETFYQPDKSNFGRHSITYVNERMNTK